MHALAGRLEMAKEFGVFRDRYPVSDLAFMRKAAFDPGDGKGSYSYRDQTLMMQLKVAMREAVDDDEKREQRRATIWLIRHLAWESKARMTMRKETQTVTIMERTHFASPAAALEILGVAFLEQLTKEETPRDPFSGQYFPEDFGLFLSPEEEALWYLPPILVHFAPAFLEGGYARKECPKNARDQIEEWMDHGGCQNFRYRVQPLPPHLRGVRRRTREECQFKPTQSGNPNGRPEGSKNKANRVRPSFFDETMTLTVGGKKERMTRRVAFFRRAHERAVKEQDNEILRLIADRHIHLSKIQAVVPYDKVWVRALSISYIYPDSLEGATQLLGGGKLVYANSSKARMLLEPWVIELGLSLLGERTLSRQEQRIVLYFARHPRRTRWPSWWADDLRERERVS
jgi:hypothetical protein